MCVFLGCDVSSDILEIAARDQMRTGRTDFQTEFPQKFKLAADARNWHGALRNFVSVLENRANITRNDIFHIE